MRFADILKHTAELCALSPCELLSDRRQKTIVRARFAAWRCARGQTRLSIVQMGRMTGGRDHSTVLNGLKQADALYESDAGFRSLCDRLERWAMLQAEPDPGLQDAMQVAAAMGAAMARLQRTMQSAIRLQAKARLLRDEGAAVTIFSQNPEGSGPDNAVTIFSQNPEGSGPDNYAIEVSDDWCGYDPPKCFYGYTLLDALCKAEKARSEAQRLHKHPTPSGEGPGVGNVPHPPKGGA